LKDEEVKKAFPCWGRIEHMFSYLQVTRTTFKVVLVIIHNAYKPLLFSLTFLQGLTILYYSEFSIALER